MSDHVPESGSPAREGRGVITSARSSRRVAPAGGSLAGAGADNSAIAPLDIPDHELLRRIGGGSYGEVWLARNIMGAYRAVKIVSRSAFDNERPFEREFHGIQKFEPISRSHPSQVAILHVGRNGDYFYYVMELADPASAECGARSAECEEKSEASAECGGPGSRPRSAEWGEEEHRGQRTEITGQRAEIEVESYVPRTLKSDVERRGRLPFGECLEIGLALTTALEHLHKHGLVHRDVKPSNVIFVNGIPKLADIGLVTDMDGTVSFVGTEGFIAPEGPGSPQADLYSLGKVLYEISTGKDRQDFPEPPTLLGDFSDREQMLELGEIIKKACAREVGDRYKSAEAMQADLLLLKTGGSVQRAHVLERRLKITRRLAMAVVAVLVLAVVPYYLAVREERVAKSEARKSRQVAEFLKDLLHGVGPSLALGHDPAMSKEFLDRTAGRIGTHLANQPQVQIEVRATLAETYRDLGLYKKEEEMARANLQMSQILGERTPGVVKALNQLSEALRHLGGLDQAEAFALQALERGKELFGLEHPDVATSLHNLARVRFDQGRESEAETLHREALALRIKLFGNEHFDVAESLHHLAEVLGDRGNLAEAEIMERRAFGMYRGLVGNEHPYVASSLDILAWLLRQQGRLGEAETMQRQALAMRRKLLGGEHPEVAASLQDVANVLWREGKLHEAEALGRESLLMRRKLLGSSHPDVADSLNSLATVLWRQGRGAEAETTEREALVLYRKLLGNEHPAVAMALDNLAAMLSTQDKLAQAEALAREGLTMRCNLLGNEHPYVAVSLNNLGRIVSDQGKLEEAEGLHRHALAIRRKYYGTDHREVANSLANLALVLERESNLAEAETISRECLAICEKKLPGEWETFNCQSQLGGILVAQKRCAEAEPLLVSGWAGLKQQEQRIPYDCKSRQREALARLVQLYEATSRPVQAAEWKQKLADFEKAQTSNQIAAVQLSVKASGQAQ